MRVAVAVDGDRVAGHFGQCEQFVVCTVEGGVVGERSVVASEAHQHGQCSAPTLLSRHGVTHLIAGGMGPRAVNALASIGIETFLGVDGSVDDVISDLVAGRLVSAPVECDHSAGACSH